MSTEMPLNAFLRKAWDNRKLIISPTGPVESIYVVLGNESCDLDSVVSALCLGLLLHEEGKLVLPLLNISQNELALRTEVMYLLKENKIPSDLLLFRNDADLEALHSSNRLRLVLVDHHVLPLADRGLAGSLVAVIDHRPLDADAQRHFPVGCDVDVRTVGSCASLVGERVLSRAPHLLDHHQVANLIRGTILLDSACFSPQADRTTPLDVAVVEACEKSAGLKETSRVETFNQILTARKDISALSSLQLLHKDLKVVNGLPLPGMPILVRDFLERPDAASALQDFCVQHLSDAAVVIGMSFEGETPDDLKRDLAVYSRGGVEQPARKVIEALLAEDSLQLEVRPSKVSGVTLFEQKNVRASRKHILPVIQRANPGT